MKKTVGALLSILFIAALTPFFGFAQTADELRQAITEHNTQIDALQKEISQYESQLAQVSAKKQTLQGTLTQLNLSIKKVQASVDLTKNQIGNTELEIKQLEQGISDKQNSISANQSALMQSLKNIHEADQLELIAEILSSDSVSNSWHDVDKLQELQVAIRNQITELANQKQQLTTTKTQREVKEQSLQQQKQALLTQQGSLSAAKNAQADLLSQTKSQESNYQKLIAQKKAQQQSFESALSDLQSKLQVAVKLSDITPAGKGVLQWPMDSVHITQYFGNTAFAQSGAYNGKGHNGVDLAASIGTPIKAAGAGKVLGTGNTDAVRGCYSFGKWVLVQHANGLDTIYAHLSQINVGAGQMVTAGQVLGYSGETGYATGPHLHFGVYVSSATQIMKLGDATKLSTPCAGATMPVAPLSGYLNPLSYL